MDFVLNKQSYTYHRSNVGNQEASQLAAALHSAHCACKLAHGFTLTLTGNPVDDITDFGRALVTVSELHHLHLQDNQITNISALGEGLGLNSSLCTLKLCNNRISNIGSLSYCLAQNSALKTISLKQNKILDISGLGKSLAANSSLQDLDLSHNDIADISELGSSLEHNSGLRTLKLQNNCICDISMLGPGKDFYDLMYELFPGLLGGRELTRTIKELIAMCAEEAPRRVGDAAYRREANEAKQKADEVARALQCRKIDHKASVEALDASFEPVREALDATPPVLTRREQREMERKAADQLENQNRQKAAYAKGSPVDSEEGRAEEDEKENEETNDMGGDEYVVEEGGYEVVPAVNSKTHRQSVQLLRASFQQVQTKLDAGERPPLSEKQSRPIASNEVGEFEESGEDEDDDDEEEDEVFDHGPSIDALRKSFEPIQGSLRQQEAQGAHDVEEEGDDRGDDEEEWSGEEEDVTASQGPQRAPDRREFTLEQPADEEVSNMSKSENISEPNLAERSCGSQDNSAFDRGFTKYDGRISKGNDLIYDTMTVAKAKEQSVLLPGCHGFTFQGKDTGQPLEIVFKGKWDVKAKKGWTSYKIDWAAMDILAGINVPSEIPLTEEEAAQRADEELEDRIIQVISNTAHFGLAINVSLQTLSLHENAIESISSLGRSLATNAALEVLDLHGNRIKDISYLGHSLATNSALKTLDLHGNAIADVSELGRSMASNGTLETLYLHENQIADVSHLGNGLSVNQKLEHLSLRKNLISDVSNFHAAPMLLTLDLSENQLADISAIGSLLMGESLLQSLDLSSNRIQDLSSLSTSLLSNASLQRLYLSSNHIADVSTLNASLPQNLALNSLYLPANNISAADKAALKERWRVNGRRSGLSV